MKIGVFGDSYAEKNSQINTTWWTILSAKYGHDVECFGESASSLIFSAKKILVLKENYDLVIWCTTQPGRMTLELGDNLVYHFQIGKDPNFFSDPVIREKFKTFQRYWVELMNWENEKFVNRCVIDSVRHSCSNLLILPAFYDPMDSFFNLHQVSLNEIKPFFNNMIPDTFYRDYRDERKGHLSQKSHEILADKLSTNLVPGVFQTEYSDFPRYDTPAFIRKK